jgi:hypothetical protein
MILTINGRVASNADGDIHGSIRVALRLAEMLGAQTGQRKNPQTLGTYFELSVRDFIWASLQSLKHVRTGKWEVIQIKSRGKDEISQYAQ